MASISQSKEVQEVMAYLTRALNLPANLQWIELRVAIGEVVQVKCEFCPEVTPPSAAPDLAFGGTPGVFGYQPAASGTACAPPRRP